MDTCAGCDDVVGSEVDVADGEVGVGVAASEAGVDVAGVEAGVEAGDAANFEESDAEDDVVVVVVVSTTLHVSPLPLYTYFLVLR